MDSTPYLPNEVIKIGQTAHTGRTEHTHRAKNINTFLVQNQTSTRNYAPQHHPVSVHIIQSVTEFHSPETCAHFVDMPVPYTVRTVSYFAPNDLQNGSHALHLYLLNSFTNRF
jgi:hypothetical protein